MVRPIPEGYHTVTPCLRIRGAADAIEFYKKAFGAEERFRLTSPDGLIVHAEIRIGDSMVMLSDEMPSQGVISPHTLGGTSGALHLYVEDVEAAWARAVAAGATVIFPLQNMFWGDRFGKLLDPFGHEWSMATHMEDIPEDELARRGAAAVLEMSGCDDSGG